MIRIYEKRLKNKYFMKNDYNEVIYNPSIITYNQISYFPIQKVNNTELQLNTSLTHIYNTNIVFKSQIPLDYIC